MEHDLSSAQEKRGGLYTESTFIILYCVPIGITTEL